MYDFGFQERIHQLHASTGFLHRTAELFIHVLTSLSELEIAREQVQITLPVDIWEQLQKELPFAIGSEFITYEWVQNIFVHLHEVFCREIRRYEGSVKLYLAEKNQNLKVAERIFFHLVESKDEDFPFAFLATYATKDTGRQDPAHAASLRFGRIQAGARPSADSVILSEQGCKDM
ncbi:MAG: hypothetical protein ACLRY6_20550 [[Clostridium] innocuum]